MPTMPEDRRAESRFPLFLPATVRSGPASSRVQLRNLSCSGAQAESLRPPPEGASVTLTRDELIVEARVAWVSGIRFGLSFDQPIRATDLLIQLSRAREAVASRAC
jgi:PilZ domain-containing protein